MSEPKEQRARVTHELKEWPEYFRHTIAGRKNFQIRYEDRDFRVGDQLLIKEWDPRGEFDSPAEKTVPVGFTGKAVLLRVDYIMDTVDFNGLGLPTELTGYVVMSTSLLP